MTATRDLSGQLEERFARLARANYQIWQQELGYLVDFVERNPRLAAIMRAVDDTEDEFDPGEWIDANMTAQSISLPPAETARIKLAWHLARAWQTGSRNWTIDGNRWFNTTYHQESARELTVQFVAPLVEFLVESLGSDSEMLHLLARYSQRVQWFEQERLYAAYVSDTARGEDGYAVDLRRFLFDQGIDYPFSEPASPAGETDIAALLDTSDPLVCEVKLYDGDSYRVGRIAGGVQQAVRYARDYGKTVAYLVIFNLCADHLALPSDDPERRPPPCLRVGGVTVYMVVVQALHWDQRASKAVRMTSS